MPRRYRVGKMSVWRRCAGALVLGLVVAPIGAQAGSWEEFESRCLLPYEAQFPPIIDGLAPVASAEDEPAYLLPGEGRLVLELVPDDGFTACRVEDPSGASGPAFDRWIAQAVGEGRYVKISETTWHSFEWIEPVVAVQKLSHGKAVVLRVLETELES